MKNLKSVLISFSLMSIMATSAFAEVSLGKATELACHRLEKLVALGRADESFLTKFNSLLVSKLQSNKPTEPAFKITFSQYAGADGSAKQIELILDANGKGIAHSVKAGADALNAPEWSDKEAISLVEQALHYLADSSDAGVKPFLSGLTSLQLKQVKNDQGITMARVIINSKDSTKTLEVTLSESGAVESTNTIIAE